MLHRSIRHTAAMVEPVVIIILVKRAGSFSYLVPLPRINEFLFVVCFLTTKPPLSSTHGK